MKIFSYLHTYLPVFYICMIRDLDAHIFLGTSGFENQEIFFLSFYTQIGT